MGSDYSTTYRSFSNAYILGERIGCASLQETIKRCTRKSDKKEFSVKIVDKRDLTGRELVALKDEIRILKGIAFEFPHIIAMSDVFDDGRRVKMVLELCEGGDLFDQLLKSPKHHFDEEKCAIITCTLARSLKYLHDHGIVHRNLKPETILFTKGGILKITGFDLAHYLKLLPPALHVMRTCCGTPHYVAPEVLTSNEYFHQIDFWSLGVILYIMLSGYQPFNSHSIDNVYKMIIRGRYKFASPHWDHVSDEAKDLVKGLMCVDYKKRFTAEQVIKHKWIVKHVQHGNSSNVDLSAYIQSIIFAYIYEYGTKFKMNIPDDLIRIIIQYYPHLLSFNLFNKNRFEILQNGKRIRGTHDNDDNGYLVYASFNDEIKGFSKGIHAWSVKKKCNHHNCDGNWNKILSIGITPFLSDDWVNGQYCDNWRWQRKPISSNNADCIRWQPTNDCWYLSKWENPWKFNEIITIKLDCDNGEVVFYKENIEIKHESIQSGIPYYFAIFLCGRADSTDFEIVEHPKSLWMTC